MPSNVRVAGSGVAAEAVMQSLFAPQTEEPSSLANVSFEFAPPVVEIAIATKGLGS